MAEKNKKNIGLTRLTPKHRRVMRQLALGYELKQICESMELSYPYWDRLRYTPLWKKEWDKLMSKMDQEVIEASLSKPVRNQLLTMSEPACRRLRYEIDNETDGTPGSRTRAAEVVVKTIMQAQGNRQAPQVVIQVTDKKLANMNMALGSDPPLVQDVEAIEVQSVFKEEDSSEGSGEPEEVKALST